MAWDGYESIEVGIVFWEGIGNGYVYDDWK